MSIVRKFNRNWIFLKSFYNPICFLRVNRENYNINDVLGEFSLTLVDSLDTLAVMGNISEFKRAVHLVMEHVRFDRNSTIQVFEATIR